MFTAIGGFFASILSALSKWAGWIGTFFAGKYHEKNKTRKVALDIARRQLKIANKRKYRRDELLAKARERKREG